jgi:hypothetical protein
MTNGIAQVVIGIALDGPRSWRRNPGSSCPSSRVDTRPFCRTPSLTSSDKKRWGGSGRSCCVPRTEQ